MATFSHDSIERVREAADLVELVSAHTDLRRSGDRYSGLCPFHDERTPSFSVQAADKLYYCFGCGAGGDVFGWVEEREGLGFPQAVEWLADRYGVELERGGEDPREEEARRWRARLGEALERVGKFYSAYLWESREAGKARSYLAERGLSERALREFGVGYAPSAWDSVLMRGQSAGFKLNELEAAGLVLKGRQGGHYDRFRARIMFPIRDPRGRPQGFGARALRRDQMPKYVNSPEGELYRKKKTLYGIDRARPRIARSGRAVVVEGYTDVIALHQAGVEEAVAVMGTAITPEQVAQLAAHTEEVVLALDADLAGREAMLRAQRVASGKRVRLRVASMPEGEDPADMLGAGGDEGAERFRELVKGADELPVFHVRALLADADTDTPPGRDRALEEVAPVLAAMGESITRTELEREVAERLRADPGIVLRRVRDAALASAAGRGRTGGSAPGERPRPPAAGAGRLAAQPVDAVSGGSAGDPGPEEPGGGQGARALQRRTPASLSGWERRERALLGMCVADSKLGREVLGRIGDELLTPLGLRARDWLAGHLADPMEGIERDDEALVSVISAVVMSAGVEPASREAYDLNLMQLEQASLERRISELERSGADPPVELHRQRNLLAERIVRARS